MPPNTSRDGVLSSCQSVICGKMPDTNVNRPMKHPMAMTTWCGLIRLAALSDAGGEGSECVVMAGQTLVAQCSRLGKMAHG
jgi:hypothetical protein